MKIRMQNRRQHRRGRGTGDTIPPGRVVEAMEGKHTQKLSAQQDHLQH